MRASIRVYGRKYKYGLLFVSLGFLIFCGIIFSSIVHGESGQGEVGSCGKNPPNSYHCFEFGTAWNLYSVNSNGPADGFYNNVWTWNKVKDICGYAGQVWVYVAYNNESPKTERGFSYQSWDTPNYVGSTSIDTVHGYYQDAAKVGSQYGDPTWGTNVMWFCWGSWSVSVNSSVNKTVADIGDTVTWTHTVKNDGPNSTTRDVTYHYQNRGDWGNSPGTPDWTLNAGTAKGDSATKTSSYTIQPSDFGKKLCRATSARAHSSSDGWWVESSPACVIVAKKPKVQVRGGDLYTTEGGNVSTSLSTWNGTYYGSWSEYGIIAAGDVTNMASAAGFASGASTSNLCESLSLLTFANVVGSAAHPSCRTTSLGSYRLATPSPLNELPARLTPNRDAPSLTGAVDLNNLANQTVYPGTGTIQLSSSAPIPKGKWIAINAPQATVRITTDIHYTTDKLFSSADIPQVVIIAKNIVIDDVVTHVDAWLVASGSGPDGVLTTCDASGVNEPRQLNSNICNKPLTVNGPVMVNHLFLYRTAGAQTASTLGSPAETFNLRPDAYLWATTLDKDRGSIPTVSTKDLPPRF